ncbi:hypothetical protein K8I28_13895 [bacterium]|nr:hypothetical protein [bacterium]
MLLSGCDDTNVTPVAGDSTSATTLDYLQPHEPGWRWMYSGFNDELISEVLMLRTIALEQVVDGKKQFIAATEYYDTSGMKLIDQVEFHLLDITENRVMISELPRRAVVGLRWYPEIAADDFINAENGDTLALIESSDHEALSSFILVSRDSTVIVPAGVFEGCVCIDRRGGALTGDKYRGGPARFVLKAGVGLLSLTYYRRGPGDHFEPIEIFNLISYEPPSADNSAPLNPYIDLSSNPLQWDCQEPDGDDLYALFLSSPLQGQTPTLHYLLNDANSSVELSIVWVELPHEMEEYEHRPIKGIFGDERYWSAIFMDLHGNYSLSEVFQY